MWHFQNKLDASSCPLVYPVLISHLILNKILKTPVNALGHFTTIIFNIHPYFLITAMPKAIRSAPNRIHQKQLGKIIARIIKIPVMTIVKPNTLNLQGLIKKTASLLHITQKAAQL